MLGTSWHRFEVVRHLEEGIEYRWSRNLTQCRWCGLERPMWISVHIPKVTWDTFERCTWRNRIRWALGRR